MKFKIRPIAESDNKALASVIRKALEDFGAAKPGTVYTDPTTDDLYTLFQEEGSIYFVLVNEKEEVLGGCGIFPTKNLPKTYAELVKLYVDGSIRGKGFGKLLMEKCINWAKDYYSALYLETLPELDKAVTLYEQLGFKRLSKRIGESGHFACNLWMLKKL